MTRLPNLHASKAAIEKLLKSIPILRTTLPDVENPIMMHGIKQWINMNRTKEIYPFLDSSKLRSNHSDDVYNNIIIEKSNDTSKLLKHTADFLDNKDKQISTVVLPHWTTPHRNEIGCFKTLLDNNVPSEMYQVVLNGLEFAEYRYQLHSELPNHQELFVHFFFQPFVANSVSWSPWPSIVMIKKSEFDLIEELYFKKYGLKYKDVKVKNAEYFEVLNQNKSQIMAYTAEILNCYQGHMKSLEYYTNKKYTNE